MAVGVPRPAATPADVDVAEEGSTEPSDGWEATAAAAKARGAAKFKEGDHCKFEPIPTVPQFRNWKSHFKKVVAGVSGRPERAFQWITEVETAKCLEDLQRSGDFETLDAKVAAGLGKILHGELGRYVTVLEEKAGASFVS